MDGMNGQRVAVLGGAGFLGSHLCERLLAEGHEVLAMDNLLTGSLRNIAHLSGEHPELIARLPDAPPVFGSREVARGFPHELLNLPIQDRKQQLRRILLLILR